MIAAGERGPPRAERTAAACGRPADHRVRGFQGDDGRSSCWITKRAIRVPWRRRPGDGPGWRARVGLPGGGPAAVITTLGVYRFDARSAEMVLASYHPGQSAESLRAATGWDLAVAPDVGETPTPTTEELRIVRDCDPGGSWTR